MGSFPNDQLEAYWKMDEASGTRVDIVNANDVADNNTVTQAVGKIGNAGQFTQANTEFLSRASTASLTMGDIGFTIAMWIYMDTKGNTTTMLFKGNSGGDFEYLLRYQTGADRLVWIVENDAAQGSVNADGLGSPSLATWYLVIAWHDPTANTLNIQVNDGTVTSASYSDGVSADGDPFEIGAIGGASTMSGRIDGVGIWRKILTSQERTDLYNLGAGHDYRPEVKTDMMQVMPL